MRTFRQMKASARRTLKTHYMLLVILLLSSTLIGGELTIGRWAYQAVESVIATQLGTARQEVSPRPFTSASQQVLTDVLEGQAQKGQERVDTYQMAENLKLPTTGRGGNRGVISAIIMAVASGELVLKLLLAIESLVGDFSLAGTVLVVSALIIYAAIWIFVLNLLRVVRRRIYLEARTYRRIPLSHALFLPRTRTWPRAAWTMLVLTIYQQLWNLTIVGGVIKRYSYLMVPFIVAENPSLPANETITLSRRLMQGHKLEAFRLQMSFAGWLLLSILTAGLGEIFFTGPYMEAALCEYYVELRRLARSGGIDGDGFPGAQLSGADHLNDRFLYEPADPAILASAYADIEQDEIYIRDHQVILPGWRGKVLKYFGIWFGTTQLKRQYQGIEDLRVETQDGRDAVAGIAYPERLNPTYIKAEEERHNRNSRRDPDSRGVCQRATRRLPITYSRVYTIWSLILLFLIFSFIGWSWEVLLHMIQEHRFVNRGALLGPWLPIYGTGGILITVALHALKKQPALEFVSAIVIAGVVEYGIAKYLEDRLFLRYWNYRGFFLNLDGRICMESLLTFGIMGMVVVYLAAPQIDDLLERLPAKVMMPLAIALISLFVADVVHSHFKPHTGEGVSQVLALGGWPETFGREDPLNMDPTDLEKLRADIQYNNDLIQAGIRCKTYEQLQLAQQEGMLEQLCSQEKAGGNSDSGYN